MPSKQSMICSILEEVNSKGLPEMTHACSILQQSVATNECTTKSLYEMMTLYAIVVQKLHDSDSLISSLYNENTKLRKELERVTTMLMKSTEEKHKAISYIQKLTEDVSNSTESSTEVIVH